MLAAEAVRRGGVRGLAFASLTGAAMLALLVAATPALAGEDTANVPVRQRSRADYDPVGVRLDAFAFYPSVTIGVQYDSNIFANPEPIGDWAFVTAPELRVVADRGDGTYVLDLGVAHYTYQKLDSEERTDAYARFRLSKPIRHDIIWDAAFEAARRHELREDALAFTDATEPIPYRDLNAQTAVTRTFNRFGVIVGGRIRNLHFEDVEAFETLPFDQSLRDGTIVTTMVKPFYDFSPGYRAYARIDLSRRDYNGEGQQNRDSQGIDGRGGLEFRLSPLLFGSAELGYLTYDYDNPIIPDIQGLSAAARLVWLMTPLMTLTLFTQRSVAELASPDQEGRLDFSAGAQLDYEILRNLILSLEGVYKNEDFIGSVRSDDIIKLTTKLDYLLNRGFHLGLTYNFIDRSSDDPNFDFQKHVVTFNVTAQH
jgi:hypothetical protein